MPPVRARGCARLGMAVAAIVLMTSATPSSASAQTAAEAFEQARQAYFRGEFQDVVRLLEPLVGGAVPTTRDPILVRESRKYLGAAYVLTGEEQRAREQFDALLRAEGADFHEYTLDVAAFPGEVLRVFADVRAELMEEVRTAEAAQAREVGERERERRAALMALLGLAQEDEVTIPHDPALAWIPFGVGQFQNGDETLGGFFLTTESVTLGAAVVLAAWTVAYEDTPGPSDPDVLRGLQIANWVSFGAFGALALAGIFEAHISFVPSHTVRREREIPADILEILQPELTVGPGTFGLRLRF